MGRYFELLVSFDEGITSEVAVCDELMLEVASSEMFESLITVTIKS